LPARVLMTLVSGHIAYEAGYEAGHEAR
jgi:hypothetical protein